MKQILIFFCQNISIALGLASFFCQGQSVQKSNPLPEAEMILPSDKQIISSKGFLDKSVISNKVTEEEFYNKQGFYFSPTILSGELDLPKNVSKPPVVYIIPGWGHIDRYGDLLEFGTLNHFETITKSLTQQHIAVFRFDKRGNGDSEGPNLLDQKLKAEIRYVILGNDFIEGYKVLSKLAQIDKKNIFILTQSEGSDILVHIMDSLIKVQRPKGVILLSNLVDKKEVKSMPVPICIINGDKDVNDPKKYVLEPHEEHRKLFPELIQDYFIISNADHAGFDLSRGNEFRKAPPHYYHRDIPQVMLRWIDKLVGR